MKNIQQDACGAMQRRLILQGKEELNFLVKTVCLSYRISKTKFTLKVNDQLCEAIEIKPKKPLF
jgi:hypothetical protein